MREIRNQFIEINMFTRHKRGREKDDKKGDVLGKKSGQAKAFWFSSFSFIKNFGKKL